MNAFIGVDTSCYTTSVACVDEKGIVCDHRTVLSVKPGERGLRQSDGLFQHIKNLEKLVPELFQTVSGLSVRAVAVSVSPRSGADSYMPVFLAGKTVAASLAAALSVPLLPVSHQDGHVRAALYGNEMLMGEPFLGMHISGGTTETFLVNESLDISLLGGGEDLHAGQFVDRVGVALGLPFPCGKHLEMLAAKADPAKSPKLPAVVKQGICSFSGVETKTQSLIRAGMNGAEIAYGVYDCMARTFYKMLVHEIDKTGVRRVLITGGVASSPLLRRLLAERFQKHGEAVLFFGEKALSSDNAVGVALRCRDHFMEKKQDKAVCRTDMF
ncbi:MAG: O-sialoglycoprotein endopeptidase [Clostridiales bacterium]|nr:O-sialoglycoprotein endopeptidase [Clostridiales bacterium]